MITLLPAIRVIESGNALNIWAKASDMVCPP